jgi:hypothetical protein
MPKAAEPWSLTSLREKLVKIGAKGVSHGRYLTFQMAEVAADIRGNSLMERDLPLPKTPKGTILAPQPSGIRAMSAKYGSS